MIEQSERWKKFDEEYLCFEKVENKRSNRPDLNAFILLDSIFPDGSDIVCHASHDEICLAFGEEHSKKLTDEQICELTRCGVRFSDDGFWMFT
jgi:hypothetical protein